MVKADPKRNYYADLEVPPNAGTEDIKKQFRKLARLYHPDRNPGNELEYVPKFQAIQAAHEILGDPDQRSKYDEARKRLGYGARAPAPRPAPYNPYTPSKAQRATRPPPNYPQSAQQQNRPQPRPQYYTQRPPPNPYHQGPASKPAPPPPPPTGASRFTNFAPPPKPAAAHEDPNLKGNVFSAWQNMNKGHGRAQPARDDAREQGPFGKASTAHPGIHRSNTTRSPRKGGFDPFAPGDFWEPPAARTSSYRTRNDSTDATSPLPNDSAEAADQMKDKTKRHSDHGLHAKATRSDEEFNYNRPSAPYRGSGGERLKVNASDFLKRSASVRDNAQMGRQFEVPTSSTPSSPMPGTPRTKNDSPMDTDPTFTTPPKPGRRAAVFEAGSESEDASSELSSKAQTGIPPEGQGNQADSNAFRPRATPGSKWAASPTRENPSVDTQFSTNNWAGVFEGSDTFQPPPPSRNTRARTSPSRSTKPKGPESANVPQEKAPQATPASSAEVKFSEDEWKKTFKEPSFVLPDPTTLNSQSSRSNSTMGRKGSRVRTARNGDRPNNVSSSTESLSNGDSSQPTREDSDAMDLDDDLVTAAKGSARQSTSSDARNVYAPPQRADWRDSSEAKPTPSAPSAVPTAVPNAAIPPSQPIPPPPPGPPPNSSRPTTRRSSVAEEAPPALNLTDLKSNLTGRGTTGVADLGDLSTTLPFPSRAAERNPAAATVATSTALRTPKMPPTPSAPAARHLTQQQWKQYVAAMSLYMGQWYQFEEQLGAHFAARHQDSAKFGTGPPNVVATSLLEARGDPVGGGIERYAEALEQDRKLREYWAAAANRHQKCVREFVAVKGRVVLDGFVQAQPQS